MNFTLWDKAVHFLAYGFGTGLAPQAPGTIGSLVAIPIFLVMASLGPLIYAGIVVALFFVGIFVCGQTASNLGAEDPGSIVYDEIIGFLVAMYQMPVDWRWIILGFAVYRFFGIWKPFPIHYVEQKLGLGLSIMTDDVIAGIYTLALLHLLKIATDRFARSKR